MNDLPTPPARDAPPSARRHRGRRPAPPPPIGQGGRETIRVDRHRAIIFPNRIREQRLRHTRSTLLSFATLMPDIPYIRLSKIERGEVFARADELVRIGAAMGVSPADLLVDVDAPGFDIAAWAAAFADGVTLDDDAEARAAILLAAATRALRHGDERFTAPRIDADFGIPPVILSRIENAQKGLSRWNPQTMAAIVALFGVADEAALRDTLESRHRDGLLDRFLPGIGDADARIEASRRRIASLRAEVSAAMPRRVPEAASPAAPHVATGETGQRRLVPVYGAALGGGLLAMTPMGARVEAPAIAGPRAFGLRVCRSTLGAGLPGMSTVIVDPDRYPQAGGLALARDGDGYRIVAVVGERDGTMRGFSSNPPREIGLDRLDPADVAAIVAALYV